MDITPLTREQVRRVDRLAIDELGIPGLVLMENAGRSVAIAIMSLLAQRGIVPTEAPTVILCGAGNNGGDGYVVARHLHLAGIGVSIVALRDPSQLTGDAAVNARIVGRMGLPIRMAASAAQVDALAGELARARLLVDAMLGTGAQGPVREPFARAIRVCNRVKRQTGALVVAIDLPSGLDADTGLPSPAAEDDGPGDGGTLTIEADLTVTLVAPKVGFAGPQARTCLGRVVVGEIGVPAELVARARDLDPRRPV